MEPQIGGQGGQGGPHITNYNPTPDVDIEVNERTVGKGDHKRTVTTVRVDVDSTNKAGEPETTTVRLRTMEGKASGIAWATLSQNELDQLQTGDPILLGHKGAARNAPPPGPAGTGNPFFAPHPMVTFFTAFFKLMQMQKWLELVANKLAVQDLRVTLEMGHKQAHDTMKAGREAYKAEMKQAYTALAGAIVGAVGVGVSLFSLTKAATTVAKQQRQAKNAERAGTKADDAAIQENTDTISKLNAKVAAKRRLLNKAPPKATVERETGDQARQELADASRSAQGKQTRRNSMEAQRKDQHDLEESGKKRAEDEAANADAIEKRVQRKHEEYLKKVQDEPNAEQLADDKLRNDIRKHEAKIKELEAKNEQLGDTKARRIKHRERVERPQHMNELMQADPWMMTWNQMSQSMQSGLQYLQHRFKGEGDLQTAYWNAQAQLTGTSVQITMKGVDSMLGVRQDAYELAKQVADSLMKISDQYQAGSRWSLS